MKVKFYRWYNAVLTVLLSMLGYGSQWICMVRQSSMVLLTQTIS